MSGMWIAGKGMNGSVRTAAGSDCRDRWMDDYDPDDPYGGAIGGAEAGYILELYKNNSLFISMMGFTLEDHEEVDGSDVRKLPDVLAGAAAELKTAGRRLAALIEAVGKSKYLEISDDYHECYNGGIYVTLAGSDGAYQAACDEYDRVMYERMTDRQERIDDLTEMMDKAAGDGVEEFRRNVKLQIESIRTTEAEADRMDAISDGYDKAMKLMTDEMNSIVDAVKRVV